ncbi:hypothetical protein ACFV23_42300 [Streptomyces sp. NPDC059627]
MLSAVDQANDAVDAAHGDWYALARSIAVLGSRCREPRVQRDGGDAERSGQRAQGRLGEADPRLVGAWRSVAVRR